MFVIRVPGGLRDELKAYLAEQGVRTGIYYEKSIHQQPLLKRYRHRKVSLKNTEQLSSEVLALPIYPGLTAAEQKHVCRTIQDFF
ncbi:MAG TPA: hypothetical protein DIS66_07500 [Candidatus Omnitrophica bacterium]|nr:hypothetical protein [Candidatus Omnitrophota bacterium]